MLAVRGRSPLIDQTIHTVYLAPLTLMTAFFGLFSPALSRKDDQLQPEPEKIVAGPRHALNGLASHQTEIAIHVADRQSEHPSREKFVYRSQHDSVATIRPPYFIAGHDVNVVDHQLDQIRHLSHVVLAIAIGVKDQIFCSALEPAAQRPAITAVARMMNDPQARLSARQIIQHRGRAVTAAVIDNDYLVVICDPRRHLQGLVNQPGYRVFVIECGEEDTDAVRSVVRFLMGVHWRMAERNFYKPNPLQSRLNKRQMRRRLRKFLSRLLVTLQSQYASFLRAMAY